VEIRPKVLVTKIGLDGHDRGSRLVAAHLRDAGMEVIYTGLRQTPEMIADAALQEDVDAIGLSILSGAHLALVPRILEILQAQGMAQLPVLIGGIIPDDDVPTLKAMGVAAVFGPGANTEAITRAFEEAAASPKAA
jgi:methylmalonyl-CoA mutase C-terminal domain/subunit